MKVKCLQLDYWMEWDTDDDDRFLEMLEDSLAHYKPCPAVYNRPGIYLDRETGKCWFELQNGRAFLYDARMFKYDLSLLMVQNLSAKQAEALQGIVDQKLATKEQRRLLYTYYCAMNSREVGRRARITSLRFLRDIGKD